MMNNLPRKNLLAALISSALLVTGCGGGGSSAPGAENNDLNGGGPDNAGSGNDSSSPINSYSGKSNISGVISLSSLNGSDAGSLGSDSGQQQRSATRRARAAINATDNAILKLFSVGSNGELIETGIECDFNTEKDVNDNPTYTCDGVADGNNYVIKYMRILENNRALEMKVSVQIPAGAADVPADDVSPQSTVVSDTIVNAILTATEGKEIDQEILDDIIASIEEVVKALVSSGAVQLPSVVVEAPKNDQGEFITDVADLDSEEDIKFAENESLESTSGSLLSDERVSAEVDAVKVEIEIREFTSVDTANSEGKRDLIKKIFRKLLDGDGDVPRFMIDFFAEQFEEGRTVDVATLFNAVNAGIEINSELVDFDLDGFQFSAADTTQDLQSALNEIYALFARRKANTLSDEDKEQLADVPGIIPAIFPAGTEITPDTVLSIPQGIVYTIYVADKYIPEMIEDETGIKSDDFISVADNGGGDVAGPVEVEFERLVDFNPMHFDETGENPGLLQLFGFFEADYLDSLSGIDIGHLDIHPDIVWIENQDFGGTGPSGSEHDSLRANVCVSDLSVMAGLFSGDAQASDLYVELGYPTKTGGRGSVALVNERDLHFGPGPGEDVQDAPAGQGHGDGPEFESCFTLDPWASVRQSPSPEGEYQSFQPSLDDIVTDFRSGKYNVIVRNSAGVVVAEREFKRKVIVGMRNASPELVSPNGRPNWPAECVGADYCIEWEERQQQFVERGGNTTFALNVDTDNDGVDDKAEVTMKWNKPQDLELPDGVRVAYSMDVVLNASSNGDYRWENIYSTHQDDKRLFGRSFTLPTLLEKLEVVDGGNYHVNICAEFIDTDNGEFLGRGGCGFAEFNVGDPIDLNAGFTLTGKAPAGLDGSWKVALINEDYQPAQAGQESFSKPAITTISVSGVDDGGNYSLTPTIGDFLNGPQSSHNSVILFRDDNGDSQLQNSPIPEDNQHEPIYWPNWEENVWFESWDRVLRVVSESTGDDGVRDREEVVVTGGETIVGPDFSYLDGQDWFQHDVAGNSGPDDATF